MSAEKLKERVKIPHSLYLPAHGDVCGQPGGHVMHVRVVVTHTLINTPWPTHRLRARVWIIIIVIWGFVLFQAVQHKEWKKGGGRGEQGAGRGE